MIFPHEKYGWLKNELEKLLYELTTGELEELSSMLQKEERRRGDSAKSTNVHRVQGTT